MEITVKNDSPLLEYLYSALTPRSRTGIKALLGHSRIAVNGKITTAFDYPLKAGDRIGILDRSPARKVDSRIRIIYEDSWLIVIDKKHGLPTMSTGRENEATAYNILSGYVRESTRGGRIFIVHRLDRDTSGLLVFAKDEMTKRLLQENWNRSVRERKYTGVAEGIFDKKEGHLVSWLTENPKSLKMKSSSTDNGGKKAITHYKVLNQKNGLSLIEITIDTGRKNQIRVQFSSIGHPIAGDRKYGALTDPFGRLALHASSLSFTHPHTGRLLAFASPAPFRL